MIKQQVVLVFITFRVTLKVLVKPPSLCFSWMNSLGICKKKSSWCMKFVDDFILFDRLEEIISKVGRWREVLE